MSFKFPVRLSDIRISTRVLRFNMTVSLFDPIFNDINKDVPIQLIMILCLLLMANFRTQFQDRLTNGTTFRQKSLYWRRSQRGLR
jgi:hypothetical protein